MRITERHLTQLAAVVETGSVTEGAALLGLSQPALSRTMSELEKRLGSPLFKPGRRPLEPTPLAQELAVEGRVILSATRKASAVIDGFRAGRDGVVRLGGIPFFMDAIVSTMLAEFLAKQSGIRVDLSYGYQPELQAALTAGQIDLAILPMVDPDPKIDFRFLPLLPARNVIACRTDHPLLRKRGLTIHDMTAYPWIEPPAGSPLLGDMRAVLLSFGVPNAQISFSGGSLLSVLTYLGETDALTILPHSVVFAVRRDRRISVLPVQIPQGQRTLGILRHADAMHAPATDRLIAFVADRFEVLKYAILQHANAVAWSR